MAYSVAKRTEVGIRNGAYNPSYRVGSERRPEFDALRAAVGSCRGLRVLDVGCGIGQMTSAVQGASQVVGLDLASNGLRNFRAPRGARAHVVEGDATQLPFRQAFDLVVSSQLLEHLESPTERDQCLGELKRVLEVDGRCVLTTYNWDVGRQHAGLAKEGFHPDGIYYYCYEAQELRDALARHFTVEAVWGVGVVLPKTYRAIVALGRYRRHWDRLWWRRSPSLSYGKLLLGILRRTR
jgi:SAM-dependent methyltransferase